MPKTFTAAFPQSVIHASAICTAAKTTYNDTTNSVLLHTFGAEGGELVFLDAIPRATVTATMLQLYVSYDAGVTLHLIDTALMAAHTVATTTAIPRTEFAEYTLDTPRLFGPSARLYVGAAVALAGGIVFSAQVREF